MAYILINEQECFFFFSEIYNLLQGICNFSVMNLSIHNADEVRVIRTKYSFRFLNFCSEVWNLRY